MKDKIFYACEGIIIGLIGHHVWNEVVLPVFVASLCAVVTLVIQFYGKKFLSMLDAKKSRRRK
jgi:hypothetical protein